MRPQRAGRIALSSMGEMLACRLDVSQTLDVDAILTKVAAVQGKPVYSVRIVPASSVVPTGRTSQIRRPVAATPVVFSDFAVLDTAKLGDQTDSVGAQSGSGSFYSHKFLLKLRDLTFEFLDAVTALTKYAAALRFRVRARANITSGAWAQPILRLNGTDFGLGKTFLGPDWVNVGGRDGIGVSYNPQGPSRWSMGDWKRIFADTAATGYAVGVEASPEVEIAEFSVELIYFDDASIGTRRYAWTPTAESWWLAYDASLSPGTYYVLIEPVVVDGLNYAAWDHTEDDETRTAESWRRDLDGIPAELLRSTGWVECAVEAVPSGAGIGYYVATFANEGNYLSDQTGSVNSIGVWAKATGPNPSYSMTGSWGSRSGALRAPAKDPGPYTASFQAASLSGTTTITLTDVAPALLRGDPYPYWTDWERALPVETAANDWAITGAATAHQAVDDPIGSPDEDYSFIQASATGQTARFRVGSSAFGSLSTPINAVTVVARAGSANEGGVHAVLESSGTIYQHPTIVTTETGWDSYVWRWATKPEGGAWSIADVQQFRSGGTRSFGVRATDANGVLVTQCYLVVEFGSTDRWLALLDGDKYVDNIDSPYDDYVLEVGDGGTITAIWPITNLLLGRVAWNWGTTGDGLVIVRDGLVVAKVPVSVATSWQDYEPPIGNAAYSFRPWKGLLEGPTTTYGALTMGGLRYALLGSNEADTSVALALWPVSADYDVPAAARYAPSEYRVSSLDRAGAHFELDADVLTSEELDGMMDRDAAADALRAMAGKTCRLRIPSVMDIYCVVGKVELTWDSDRRKLHAKLEVWQVAGPRVDDLT